MSLIVSGIIIKSTPYKEADAIITLISKEYGLVVFKARGVLKINSKNASGCQLYTYGEYQIEYRNENGNKTLSSANRIEYPYLVFSNLAYNSLLSFLSEAIIKCEENSQYEGFDLFYETIQAAKRGADILTLTLIIVKYILLWNGIGLEVDHCIHCFSEKNIIGVSYDEGGFVCQKCQNNQTIKYDPEILKIIRCIMKAKIENVFSFNVPITVGYDILCRLIAFLENATGLTLKSKEMIFLAFR